jgi:mannose-1-phosphate guanylyltransferase/mannose-6-phosphate isomerase
MEVNMISVILAGGRGLRLWPESRRQCPKQLCKFIGNKTMLDHTIDRLLQVGAKQIDIITSDDLKPAFVEIVAKRTDKVPINILSEPEGKNTAPAVGLVLAKYSRQNPDDIIGIFPADHHVQNNDAFIASINQAAHAARQGYLATIGITPDRPEIGYGYIERTKWEIGELNNVFPVHAFYEKPDLTRAQSYVSSGQHMWNAGIYISQLSTLLQEFAAYLPEIHHQISRGYDDYLKSYSKMPDISLDYGIAEKTQRLVVVPSNFGWCDLGSWNALADLQQTDSEGNALIGDDVILKDSRKCFIRQSDKTIVLYGVENLLVVETENIIFISDRNKAQNIKDMVEFITEKKRHDLL